MYSGYGFGENALSKALSSLGATAPIACRLANAGALLWNKMNGVDVVYKVSSSYHLCVECFSHSHLIQKCIQNQR